MTRLLVALLFALASCSLVALPARANTCTIPNSLTNGQVVDATGLNANFTSLQSCGNNIDSTNIGPAGILASNIIAASAAAGTFGGTATYKFPNSLNVSGLLAVTGNLTASGSIVAGTSPPTALSGDGAFSRSAGIGVVYLGSGGTATLDYGLSAASTFTLIGGPLVLFGHPLAISSGGTGSAAQNFVDLTTGQSIAGNKAFSSAVSVAGGLSGATSGTATQSYYPPLYTFAGGALGANTHGVVGTTSCTTNTSGNCNVNVSFTGGVAFTTSSTFACRGDYVSGAAVSGYITFANLSAATISVSINGGTVSTALTVAVSCDGY